MEHGKFIKQNGGFVYDAAALAIFAAFTTPPSAARKDVINNLVVALKGAGIWAKLDILYLTAAADSQAARINWMTPGTYTASAVNSPTFVADRGYTGNGTTSRLDTGWTPSTHAVQFTQNDASLWAWSLTDIAAGLYDIGSISTNPQSAVNTRNASDQAGTKVNSGNTFVTANTDGRGFVGGQRRASNDLRLWRNSSQLSSTAGLASTGVPTQSQWICGANITNFGTKQIAAAAWGASLSGLEASFYNAVLVYMQSVGAV